MHVFPLKASVDSPGSMRVVHSGTLIRESKIRKKKKNQNEKSVALVADT